MPEGTNWFDWAKVVVGVGSAAGGIYSQRQHAKSANKQMALAEGRAKYQQQLANAMLANAESSYDDESYRRAAGLLRYFLGGGQAVNKDGSYINVPGIRQQFDQVDESVNKKLLDLDGVERDQAQKINDTMTGGQRIRALKELSMRVADAKGQATRGARDVKRDLNVKITNEWFNKAMAFGQSQPGTRADAYAKAGGFQTGESGAALNAAVNAMGVQRQAMGDIMKYSGFYGDQETRTKDTEPLMQQKTIPSKTPTASEPMSKSAVKKQTLYDPMYDPGY